MLIKVLYRERQFCTIVEDKGGGEMCIESRNKKSLIIRNVFYFVGLFFVALGIVFTIQAQLGVSPWDVLHIGIAKVTHISVGVSTILIGAVVLCFLLVLDRKSIKWGLLGNLILIGVYMDIIMYFDLIPVMHQAFGQWGWLLVGLVIHAYGLSMYITADFGAGPRDSLMLALHRKFQLSIRLIRTIIEVTVLSIGWILGGPVSVGTLVIAFTSGPILQYFLEFNQKLLHRMVD